MSINRLSVMYLVRVTQLGSNPSLHPNRARLVHAASKALKEASNTAGGPASTAGGGVGFGLGLGEGQEACTKLRETAITPMQALKFNIGLILNTHNNVGGCL